MKYTIKPTTKFKKDYKLLKKQNLNLVLLKEVVDLLADGKPLPEKYNDHPLSGNWAHHRECHIQPDWLLIYYYDNDALVLTLSRTGSHGNLFGK